MSRNPGKRRYFILSFVALAVAGVVACGGPSDPSNEGVTLRGALEGGGGPAGFGATEPIVVRVEEAPSITTTVGAGGSFTLRGLPDGSFTLVFTRGSQMLGSLRFDAVKPKEEITIKVALSANGNSIILLEEKRSGIGHGELEFEGLVESVLSRDPDGDSRFQIAGYTVLARAGYTNIHLGNSHRTVSNVLVGLRALVKGRWLESTTGAGQLVLASDINLREDGDDDSNKDCLISGGKVGKKIELEGTVASGDAMRFELRVNGNRAKDLVDVDAGSASFKCNGNKGLPPGQCEALVKAGAKVHVSGLLESCDEVAARVAASEVKVQK